jgi:hypothetical protein
LSGACAKSAKQTESRAIDPQHLLTRRAFSARFGFDDFRSSLLI